MAIVRTSIVTPRPPLNLFEVTRKTLSGDESDYQTIYCARNYVIPGSGFSAKRTIQTATIMTGLIVSNTSDQTVYVSVAIKGLKLNEIDPRETFTIIKEVPIEPNDFASISLDRQVMRSSAVEITPADNDDEDKGGEELQLKVHTLNTTVDVHFSYIINQREEYQEVVSV